MSSRIEKAVSEMLAWSRGEIRLPVWLPDGTTEEMNVEEWAHFRLGRVANSEALESRKAGLADANTKSEPPIRSLATKDP